MVKSYFYFLLVILVLIVINGVCLTFRYLCALTFSHEYRPHVFFCTLKFCTKSIMRIVIHFSIVSGNIDFDKYSINLKKKNFSAFQSPYCESDSLIVSRVGDANFADGVRHCGPRSFTAVSRTNRMSVKFTAKRWTKSGRFMCSMGAKRMDFRIPEPLKNSQFCECGDENQVRRDEYL